MGRVCVGVACDQEKIEAQEIHRRGWLCWSLLKTVLKFPIYSEKENFLILGNLVYACATEHERTKVRNH
jgi:hypothetical protein